MGYAGLDVYMEVKRGFTKFWDENIIEKQIDKFKIITYLEK